MQQSPAATKGQPIATSSAAGGARRHLPRPLLAGLREVGVDLESAARRAGISSDALEQGLPHEAAERFLGIAFASLNEPAFGLAFGSRVRPELFGVIGFAAMSCATFGGALACFCRYKRVVIGDRIELLPSGPLMTVRFHHAHHGSAVVQQLIDAELAYVVAFGAFLTGRAIRPERVSVQFSRPPYAARYAEVFGGPVVFDAPHNELVLRGADLERPLVSHSPDLAALFGERAEAWLAEASDEDIRAKVRAVLCRSLRGEPPDVVAVAKQLAMGERSLQRRLRAAGTSFQEVLSEVRHQAARKLLADPRSEAVEISFLLGFAHPNSFYRAFKRWTGMTPEEYRARAAGSAPPAAPPSLG